MSAYTDIDDLLDEIVTLPSLPRSVLKLQEMVNDPDVALKDIGEVISTDPAVAFKTLRLVNSAQYGRGTEISSVEHAVAMLGLTVIRNLVLSVAVLDQLKGGSDECLKHSLAVGLACEMVADGSPGVGIAPDEAFVYGVLHDIGTIVLFEHLNEKYEKAAGMAHSQSIPMYKAEQAVIGVDHAELGGRLAHQWRLPEAICNAIHAHHDLSRCSRPEHRTLAAMVSAADHLCWSAGLGSGLERPVTAAEGTWEQLLIGPEEAAQIADTFFEAVPNLNELFTLATG